MTLGFWSVEKMGPGEIGLSPPAIMRLLEKSARVTGSAYLGGRRATCLTLSGTGKDGEASTAAGRLSMIFHGRGLLRLPVVTPVGTTS